ncbi:MAG TPA: adenylate/guanylate cyclase domain-containing protein [Anaerolineae bacterium]|nr:adenylate/guanylate cyclase domain-containing protein [Anaerolineae bacterium]
MSETPNPRRLAAILAADVAGYTKLVEQNTDGTIAAWKAARDDVIKPHVEEKSGTIIKFTGDGFLAEFPSVQDAVACAITLQEHLAESSLNFRMGLNTGDVTDDGGDIHGEGINIAARLEALAEPGGICISGDVYNQVQNRIDATFNDLGEHQVKNVSRPVRVYAIAIGEATGDTIIKGSAPKSRFLQVAVAAVVAVGVLAGVGWWWTERPEFTPADPAKMQYVLDKPSIAVLAFTNLTGDPEQEHVSDGISEDIISTLARLPSVVVIARNSSFSYKGKASDVRQIAEEMSVRYVLEGSLQSFGENIRITAQLIDAVSGHHVWSQKFDRPRAEFFKVRDEITFRIIQELNAKLVEGSAHNSNSNSFKTLEVWLLARKAVSHARLWNKVDNQIALDLVHRILKIEPDSVWANSEVSRRYAMQIQFGWADDREAALRKATEYAEKAIALNPTAPDGYDAMAYVRFNQGRIEEAIEFEEKALDHAPGDSLMTTLLALYYQKDMQPDRAIETFERAVRSDRLAAAWAWENYGESLIMAGRYEEAIPIYFEALKSAKGFFVTEIHLGLAIAYDALGQDDKAQAAIRAAIESYPRLTVPYLRNFQRYKDQDYKDRWLAKLKRLGVPEE